MNYNNKKVAGLLLFVAAAVFILPAIVSEAIYSGYSVGQQNMSDLGNWSLAGNAAAIFDVSVILVGIFSIAAAYFIQRTFNKKLFTSLLVITGISSIGVGIVAENINFLLHALFAVILLVGWGAAAFMSYKFEKSPLSYISVILGAVILLAFVLWISGYANSAFWLGLGKGGMERFIIYPAFLWMLGFGAHLIGDSGAASTTSKT